MWFLCWFNGVILRCRDAYPNNVYRSLAQLTMNIFNQGWNWRHHFQSVRFRWKLFARVQILFNCFFLVDFTIHALQCIEFNIVYTLVRSRVGNYNVGGIKVSDWKISWQNNWFHSLYQWVWFERIKLKRAIMSIVEIFAEKLQFFSFLYLFWYSHWTWKVRTQNGFIRFSNSSRIPMRNVYRTRQNLKKVVEPYGPSNQFVNGLKRHLLISNFIDLLSACIDTQHIDIHG